MPEITRPLRPIKPRLKPMLVALILALFGALIGSFANVVIYRLPRGESIVFPGSHCPNCGHELGALELIPVVSWAALGARCRRCKNSISARYPLVETLFALGFFTLVLRYPLESYGLSVFFLLALFALLVILAAIDIDTQLLPDALTFPALAVALVGTLFYSPESGLPNFLAALYGACLGAGMLALLNRVGALVLRRFRDTKERLWPIGMEQVNVASAFGRVRLAFRLFRGGGVARAQLRYSPHVAAAGTARVWTLAGRLSRNEHTVTQSADGGVGVAGRCGRRGACRGALLVAARPQEPGGSVRTCR